MNQHFFRRLATLLAALALSAALPCWASHGDDPCFGPGDDPVGGDAISPGEDTSSTWCGDDQRPAPSS